MYGVSLILLIVELIVQTGALSMLKLRHDIPYLLTTDDLLRLDRSLTDDMGNSIIEHLEIREVEKSDKNLPRKIYLRSERREIRMGLQPMDNIISPNIRVTVIDGKESYETQVDDSTRGLFFRGIVEGSDGGEASLMKHNDVWKGVLFLDGEAFAINNEPQTGEHLLIKIVNDHDSIDVPLMEATEQNTRIIKEKRHIKQEKRKQDLTNLKIELGVYVDQALYERFEKNVDDPIAETQRFATLVVNIASVYYEKPSLGVPVEVVLAKLVILKKDPAFVTVTGEDVKYFESFCVWEAEYQNPRGLLYDVALMLTGLDLYSEDGNAVVGLGNFWGTCNNFAARSCVITEGLRITAGIITAHELGHNLGMFHDSDDCDPLRYVMSWRNYPGQTNFSSCSRAYFEGFMEELDDFNHNCLRIDVSGKTLDFEDDLLPGERLSDDEQECTSILGSPWYDHLHESYCSTQWCTDGTDIKKLFQSPMPGSRCGENKICWDTECLDRSEVYRRRQWKHNGFQLPEPLSPDEICYKYGPEENYTKGVFYDEDKGEDSEKWRGFCRQEFRCALPDFSDSYSLNYYPAVPTGTPCYKNKVCKHFRCEDKDSPDYPIDSSDVVEIVRSSGEPQQNLSRETREKLEHFCKTYANESTHPVKSKDCGIVVCEDEYYYYEFPAYRFSVCPKGQMCTVEGDCVEDSGKPLKGELTKEELIHADKLCRGKYGDDYQSLCRRSALSFSWTANEYCADGLCKNVACYAIQNWTYDLRLFSTPLGSPCGGGKKCSRKGCTKTSIKQKMRISSKSRK